MSGHNPTFNPGPPSTSRKKRTQIGARGIPHARAVKVPWFVTESCRAKYKAKRRARKAIGARGVKTNSSRPVKRVVPVEQA